MDIWRRQTNGDIDDAVAAPRTEQRVSIGIALGGGAARGFAHIGALRVLRDAGYELDAIAGTSIGAVVGGCFLAGKLDALEDWARALTRRRILGMLDFSLGGSGLIYGGRFPGPGARHRRHHHRSLPKPFAAIATEIGPGHEIWLTKGSFVMAMRASCPLPGIFEPVRLNGRWLMDGALVNPVPVSAVACAWCPRRHRGQPQCRQFRPRHHHPGSRSRRR